MFNYWKFVNIYHNFKSNLLWRHISSIGKCLPSDMQTNRQIFFSQIFQNPWKRRKKKHLSKELLSCENSSVVFWQNEQKKEMKEKFPNRIYEFWLIWKKRKRVLKLEKNKQQWYIIVWQTNFFAFCFLLKKWPPHGNFI